MSASQWEQGDRRESTRVRLQLRLAVVYPQHAGSPYRPIHHGRSHDVCMSGLSMIVDENVFHEGRVTVLLALPPLHPWASQKIITTIAKMTYAIHSSKLNGFKIGLAFLEFKHDGKALLEAALRRELDRAGGAGMQTTSARLRAHRPRDSQLRGR